MDRMLKLFPEAYEKDCLHIFSGSLEPGPYTRVDMREDIDTDIRMNVESLSEIGKQYDFIFADPPYTEEDSNRYGVPMVNRNKVIREIYSVLRPGGFLVWLDMTLPMYRKDELKRCGEIMVTRSTNHRVRGAFIWEKL